MTGARARGEAGFVAIEFVASIAMLLVPTIVLVASIPVWSERRNAATVLAREVARAAAAHWPSDTAVDDVIDAVADDYGVPRSDLSVSVHTDSARGGQADAHVTVVMPALHLPLIGDEGAWRWSTNYAVRIDDYRSR